MATTMSQVTEFNVLGGDSGTQKGLKIRRYFTRAEVDPYDEIEWEQRVASIINEKGKVVFEQTNVEIPNFTAASLVRSLPRSDADDATAIPRGGCGRRNSPVVFVVVPSREH